MFRSVLFLLLYVTVHRRLVGLCGARTTRISSAHSQNPYKTFKLIHKHINFARQLAQPIIVGGSDSEIFCTRKHIKINFLGKSFRREKLKQKKESAESEAKKKHMNTPKHRTEFKLFCVRDATKVRKLEKLELNYKHLGEAKNFSNSIWKLTNV